MATRSQPTDQIPLDDLPFLLPLAAEHQGRLCPDGARRAGFCSRSAIFDNHWAGPSRRAGDGFPVGEYERRQR
jgi:hypothetical protein